MNTNGKEDHLEPIRTKENFLVFGAPLIGDEEINEVVDSMKKGWLGTGPKVAQFQQDFATYKGAEYALGLNSCTAALHLAMVAASIGAGDEVITTPMTFCATINSIIHTGATPVLADVELDSMNIDPLEIEKKITPKTKAILIVHFAGRPCNMDAISEIARKNKVLLIEDCAHAIETEYKNSPAGLFGDIGCFSFYSTKNIATGEGGILLTNNEDYAKKAKTLSLHGMSSDAWNRFSSSGYKHYSVTEAGFKYNMMDIQAAIGIHQLRRIENWWIKREQIWERYNSAFSTLPIGTPFKPELNTRHAYHLYTLLIDKSLCGISRDEFLIGMNRENIGCGVHYLSIPEHPYYQNKFSWSPSQYPNAARIGAQTVSLPISAKLNDQDVQDVISAVKRVLKC